ncbi:MAG: ATP-dependent Clp protease proteolytic subunit [Chitinivibrionales bacterium]|nr:ATP-dependent Clp protease proteolytic subunit [Chitinivibrionales bacterium]
MPNKNSEFEHKMKKMFVGSEIEEKMMSRREIFLWGPVDDDSAKSIVQKILYFAGKGDDDIKLYINSPGGVISSGLAILDAMRYVKSDVSTICMGQAASMGSLLLCAGTKGKRFAWKNARVLIHQPLISGNFFGPASDIEIQAEEMMRVRESLNKILADATGQPLEKIEEDTDRDYFMSAEEAKAYGLVDSIIEKID